MGPETTVQLARQPALAALGPTMPPAPSPRHRLALAALLLLRHAGHARAPAAACPPPAALTSLCGAARAVSSGNCAVCVADKVARSHPPAVCSNEQIDAFCSGAALAPPPPRRPPGGGGTPPRLGYSRCDTAMKK